VPLTLAGINRYPVKSCRGEALPTARLEPWGLAGDRRWMIVDEDGEAITAREVPELLLIEPRLVDGGLVLSGPDLDDLLVRIPSGPSVEVTVFGREPFTVRLAEAAAHAWCSKVVGAAARLVYQDDPTRRAVNPRFSRPDDRVSFADGYPLLLASEASLTALNALISSGRHPAEAPVPMTRFRPNLVIRGAVAWDEDHWRRIQVGAAVFRVVKGCDRCVITVTDPATGVRGKEPLATLARHRRWDGKSWFAMNLVPDTAGAVIRIGDEVEVLDREESDGPPR
jgi:uncharacterized protein YcbX